jgi:hypothetical protein
MFTIDVDSKDLDVGAREATHDQDTESKIYSHESKVIREEKDIIDS